jgi:hypothetical protein
MKRISHLDTLSSKIMIISYFLFWLLEFTNIVKYSSESFEEWTKQIDYFLNIDGYCKNKYIYFLNNCFVKE